MIMTAFEQIVTELGPGIARVVASYERNPVARQDLAQEVLIAIYKSLPALRDQTKLRPFVFRIAHNRCLDHVIRHSKKPKMDELPHDLCGSDDSPEQHMVARERSRSVIDAVRALEIPYRQVMTLLLEDMSYAEIAETLGITISNVGVRVNRAKNQLKTLLQR
jgi:RNA polymerase sigma-70 factor (ECF subfamily)